MLWGTSSLATYVPWGGNAGPYLGVGLWLWLGVLDAVQGVGLGMILLQTLSRLHVMATLAFSQIIGSAVVMIARATSPDGIGPGPVFPNLGTWNPADGLKGSPIVEPTFWVALGCQLIIVAGYFWFYRREELGMCLVNYFPVLVLMCNCLHSSALDVDVWWDFFLWIFVYIYGTFLYPTLDHYILVYPIIVCRVLWTTLLWTIYVCSTCSYNTFITVGIS